VGESFLENLRPKDNDEEVSKDWIPKLKMNYWGLN